MGAGQKDTKGVTPKNVPSTEFKNTPKCNRKNIPNIQKRGETFEVSWRQGASDFTPYTAAATAPRASDMSDDDEDEKLIDFAQNSNFPRIRPSGGLRASLI